MNVAGKPRKWLNLYPSNTEPLSWSRGVSATPRARCEAAVPARLVPGRVQPQRGNI